MGSIYGDTIEKLEDRIAKAKKRCPSGLSQNEQTVTVSVGVAEKLIKDYHAHRKYVRSLPGAKEGGGQRIP